MLSYLCQILRAKEGVWKEVGAVSAVGLLGVTRFPHYPALSANALDVVDVSRTVMKYKAFANLSWRRQKQTVH